MAGIEAGGKHVERAGQPAEAGDLILQRDEYLRPGRDDTLTQTLEIAVEVGQRRAELVREVLDQIAAKSFLVLEAGRHLVERVRNRRQLGSRGPIDACLVASAGDAASSPG